MTLHRVLGSIVAAVLFACCARPASACSICRCGDPTFNALGSDSYHAEGFRAAFDWERFDKSQGDPAEEAEGVVENRFTALLSYGFNDRLAVTGRIPFSHRNLVATEEGVAERPHDQRAACPTPRSTRSSVSGPHRSAGGWGGAPLSPSSEA